MTYLNSDPVEFMPMVAQHKATIAKWCSATAFRMNLQYSDLISDVYYRIALKETKGTWDGTLMEFRKYMHIIVRTAAFDLYRNSPKNHVDIEEIYTDFHPAFGFSSGNDQIMDYQDLINNVRAYVEAKGRKNHLLVFDKYFIEQKTYEETSKELGINIGSIKTMIFYMREYIAEKYKDCYKELIY